VKLGLGSRKTGKRKQRVLAGAGRSPRKPRFARAPGARSEREEVLRSRAEAEAAIADAQIP